MRVQPARLMCVAGRTHAVMQATPTVVPTAAAAPDAQPRAPAVDRVGPTGETIMAAAFTEPLEEPKLVLSGVRVE